MDETHLLLNKTITIALTEDVVDSLSTKIPNWAKNLLIEADFDYGSGGTTANVIIETTIDGTNWIQIANISFTTADARKSVNLSGRTPVTTVYDSTAVLGSDTVKDGIIGQQIRSKLTTTGTYGGDTAITVNVMVK